jgi:hypothetical protein
MAQPVSQPAVYANGLMNFTGCIIRLCNKAQINNSYPYTLIAKWTRHNTNTLRKSRRLVLVGVSFLVFLYYTCCVLTDTHYKLILFKYSISLKSYMFSIGEARCAIEADICYFSVPSFHWHSDHRVLNVTVDKQLYLQNIWPLHISFLEVYHLYKYELVYQLSHGCF